MHWKLRLIDFETLWKSSSGGEAELSISFYQLLLEFILIPSLFFYQLTIVHFFFIINFTFQTAFDIMSLFLSLSMSWIKSVYQSVTVDFLS